MKKIDTFVLGMVEVNTYLLWNDNHVLIVDPGSKAPKLQEAIDSNHAIVDGIVLTHAHFDHIAGVDELAKKYTCQLYMNDLDVPLLQDPELNFSFGKPTIVHTKPTILQPGRNTIGAFTFRVIDAPGHSEGCIMLEWEHNLFSGDVIFRESIGRTDLKTSSNTKMMQSLQMIKETLSPDLIVYPGHGPSTTLAHEFKYNPFLQ